MLITRYLFCFFILLNTSIAWGKEPMNNAVKIYLAYSGSLCSMLSIEQKMVDELDQVAKKMDLNTFMSLRPDDPSIPPEIKKHADRVAKYSSDMQMITNTIPWEELQQVSEILSPDEKDELHQAVVKHLENHCNLGDDPWRKGRVGQWLITANKAHEIELIRKDAMEGNSKAQYVFGSMLVRGEQVQQNCKEGIEWLKKASSGGIADASMVLARLYKDGFICGIRDKDQFEYYQTLWEQQSK